MPRDALVFPPDLLLAHANILLTIMLLIIDFFTPQSLLPQQGISVVHTVETRATFYRGPSSLFVVFTTAYLLLKSGRLAIS